MSVGLGLFGHGVDVLTIPVRHEPLQTTDGYRLALDAPDAAGFTLGLLGADPAGKGGQGIGGGDDLIGGLEVALDHLGNEFGDPHIHGAAFHALGILAVQAAAGFGHGHLGGIAQGNLSEVPGTDLGVLLGHGGFGKRHICHFRILLI